jgi:hypothetical protein
MTKFEDLAKNVQALMLAKMAMEMNTHRCANLFELAKRGRTDVADAWRRICQLSGQPVCTIPHNALHPSGA